MPIDDRRGIFADKKAMALAKKYGLDLTDKRCYISDNKYISHNDVKFIVGNLWIDHFMYGVRPPIEVDVVTYNRYYLNFVCFDRVQF